MFLRIWAWGFGSCRGGGLRGVVDGCGVVGLGFRISSRGLKAMVTDLGFLSVQVYFDL